MSKVLHILFYKPLPEKLPPLPGLLRKLRKLGEVKQQILTSVKQREMNLMFKQCHVWFCFESPLCSCVSWFYKGKHTLVIGHTTCWHGISWFKASSYITPWKITFYLVFFIFLSVSKALSSNPSALPLHPSIHTWRSLEEFPPPCKTSEGRYLFH